jgi:hypothetical protein
VLNDGFWGLNIFYIFKEIFLPIMGTLGYFLTIPYIFSRGILPLIGKKKNFENFFFIFLVNSPKILWLGYQFSFSLFVDLHFLFYAAR